MDSLFNPHAVQERARRSQIGAQETGRELSHVGEGLHGFPTAPTSCQAPGDNADALQWATPRSRKAAAQRQGSGDGHSDIKAAFALKPVMFGPERVNADLPSRAGGRVSGKRLWEIQSYGETDLGVALAESRGPEAGGGKAWDRRLDKTNLQVLCSTCNAGKGARSEDWR